MSPNSKPSAVVWERNVLRHTSLSGDGSMFIMSGNLKPELTAIIPLYQQSKKTHYLLLQLETENALCRALRDDTFALERITVNQLMGSFLLLWKPNFKVLIRKSEQVSSNSHTHTQLFSYLF